MSSAKASSCAALLRVLSLIPSTLGDRSNPPPDSDDSDDELEYDIYGWFNFETDAEGVKRLDRKWVPLAAAAAAEDFSDALEAYEARLEAKKKDFEKKDFE